jgi:hypothetical protein
VDKEDGVPVPATVEMIPDEDTARTLWPLFSTTKRVPNVFCHTPTGSLTLAEVASPPSPDDEADPVPATVFVKYDGGGEAADGTTDGKLDDGLAVGLLEEI